MSPGIIQTLIITIMNRAPSSTVEWLSQQIEDLTQIIYSEQIVSADLKMEFSELQKEVNIF